MIINDFPLLSHRIVGGCINHFVKKKIDHSAFIVGVCSIALSQVQHCVYNRLLNEPTLRTSKVQLETLYRRVDLGGGSGGSDPSPPLPSDLWVSLLPVRNRTSPLNLKYSERADLCVVIWFLGKEKFCVLGIKFEPPSLRKIPESGLNIKGFEFIIIYSTRIWRQSN